MELYRDDVFYGEDLWSEIKGVASSEWSDLKKNISGRAAAAVAPSSGAPKTPAPSTAAKRPSPLGMFGNPMVIAGAVGVGALILVMSSKRKR